ncbi:MAG: hypothetical protein ACLFNB_01395 [Candidatus Woesearchaeota archaeon]
MKQEQTLDIIGEGFFDGTPLYVDIEGNIYTSNPKLSSLPTSPVNDYRKANNSKLYLPFTMEKPVPRLYKSFVERFMDDHPNQELVDKVKEDFLHKGEDENKLNIIAKAEQVKTQREYHDALFLDDHFKVYGLSSSRNIASPWNDHKFYNNASYFEELWEPMTGEIYSLFTGRFEKGYESAEEFLNTIIKPLKERSIPKHIRKELEKQYGQTIPVNVFTGENLQLVGNAPLGSASIHLDSKSDLYLREDDRSPLLVNRPYSNFVELYKMVYDPEAQLALFFSSEMKDDPNTRKEFMDKHDLDYERIDELLQNEKILNKAKQYVNF